MSTKKIAIAQAKRTPIGAFLGSMSSLTAVDLAANLIEGIFNDSPIDKTAVDEVYFGNVVSAGSGQNPARQAALKAGFPVQVPASVVNTVCGSGLHAVGLAFQSILAGNARIILAGGMESMSNVPHYVKNMRNGVKLGHSEMQDGILADGLTCPINQYHMGITAENVAREFQISRAEQDEYAYHSQMKAASARKEGRFNDEIHPILVKTRREEILVNQDEFIKENTTLEGLAKLRPAFTADGTVTAGNSSGINDGAAAMLVLEEDLCKQAGLQPMAIIHGFSMVGLRPDIMGMGPVYAVRKLQQQLDFDLQQVGLWELNEAFAAQSVAVVKELQIAEDKVNVNGGAIALGHPIGASGARILVTLLWEMKRRGTRFGIASLCVGTGMGLAMLVENPAAA